MRNYTHADVEITLGPAHHGKKIECIKTLRSLLFVPLKDSKQIVEQQETHLNLKVYVRLTMQQLGTLTCNTIFGDRLASVVVKDAHEEIPRTKYIELP